MMAQQYNPNFSMQNDYVKSILDPQNNVVDIPDDIMRLHSKRQETVTYNLTAPTSGSGIIVMWPNNPTYTIGAHYTLSGTSYMFDQLLLTAQQLGQSYDYGRKVSQLITVRSSTLPAGVYALNGTFNAITFQGTLSEVLPISYGTLLSSTSNQNDKKGNVLVGTGLAVLSLPAQFDMPYVRMDDPDPSATGQVTTVLNKNADMDYVSVIPPSTTTLVPGANTVVTATFNLDSLDGFNVHTQVLMSTLIQCTLISVTVSPLDINGTVITTYSAAPYIGQSVGIPDFVPQIDCMMQVPPQDQPVCAVTVAVVYNTLLNGTVTIIGGSRICATVRNANQQGYIAPTVIVAYQGVSPASVITVAGVTNFELVPNPALQKNLPLTYGAYKPHDLVYAKLLLANRDKIGIRSIYEMGEYNALLAKLEPITDYSVSADSFDFGSLLRMLKNLAVPAAAALLPVASAAFPGAAPALTAGYGLLQALMGKSASGMALSASGRPLALSSDASCINLHLTDKAYSPSSEYVLDVSGAGIALFPVILSMRGVPLSTDPMMVYAAITVTDSIRSQLPSLKDYPNYLAGAHRVYGCPEAPLANAKTGLMSPAMVVSDIFLTPVFNLSGSRIMTITNPPMVQGSSHELAVCVALKRLSQSRVGLAPSALYTGGVSGYSIMPVLGIDLKKGLAHSLGLQLVGNSPGCDVMVSKVYSAIALQLPSLQSMTKPSGTLDLSEFRALTLSKHAMSFRAWLHDGADQEYSDTVQVYAYSMSDNDVWIDEPDESDPDYWASLPPPPTEEELLFPSSRYDPVPILPMPPEEYTRTSEYDDWGRAATGVYDLDDYMAVSQLGSRVMQVFGPVVDYALGRLVLTSKLTGFLSSAFETKPAAATIAESAQNFWDNNAQLQQTVPLRDYVEDSVAHGHVLVPQPNKSSRIISSLTNIWRNNQKLGSLVSLERFLADNSHLEKVPDIPQLVARYTNELPATTTAFQYAGTPRGQALAKSLTGMWTNNVRLQKSVTLDNFVQHYVAKGHVPTPQEAMTTFPAPAPQKSNITTITQKPQEQKLSTWAVNVYGNNAKLRDATSLEAFIGMVMRIGRPLAPQEVQMLIDELQPPPAPSSQRYDTSFPLPGAAVQQQTVGGTGTLENKAVNVYKSNALLQKTMTLPEFVDFCQRHGRVPTSQEIKTAFSGEAGSPKVSYAQPADTKVTAPRNYISYVGILGAQRTEAAERQVKKMVDDVFAKNGGKGPNAEQNKALVNRIKEYANSQRTPTGAANVQSGAVRTVGGAPPTTYMGSLSGRLEQLRTLRADRELV
jgi:hypothetical protein